MCYLTLYRQSYHWRAILMNSLKPQEKLQPEVAAQARPNTPPKQEESIVPDLIEVGLESTTDTDALLHLAATGARAAAAGITDLAAGAVDLAGGMASAAAEAVCGAAEVGGHAIAGTAEVIGEVVSAAAELVGELIAGALS